MRAPAAGTVNRGASGGGYNQVNVQMSPITIDATGADPAGLARVERSVKQLQDAMPKMAVQAVQEALYNGEIR
jgi:hypothetical protein